MWLFLKNINRRSDIVLIGLHLFIRKPNKLCVAWTRRGRRLVTELQPWEPTMKDPLRGVATWPIPDNREASITLFKDPRTNQLEDKEWTFIVEDVIYLFFNIYYSVHYNVIVLVQNTALFQNANFSRTIIRIIMTKNKNTCNRILKTMQNIANKQIFILILQI